jgi:hypothetical protein
MCFSLLGLLVFRYVSLKKHQFLFSFLFILISFSIIWSSYTCVFTLFTDECGVTSTILSCVLFAFHGSSPLLSTSKGLIKLFYSFIVRNCVCVWPHIQSLLLLWKGSFLSQRWSFPLFFPETIQWPEHLKLSPIIRKDQWIFKCLFLCSTLFFFTELSFILKGVIL